MIDSEMVKKVFKTKNYFGYVLGVTLVFAALHLLLGQFARSGNWLVLSSVVMVSRPVIRQGYKEWYEQSKIIYGGTFDEPTVEEKENEEQEKLDALLIQKVAPWTIIVGTLLAIYG